MHGVCWACWNRCNDDGSTKWLRDLLARVDVKSDVELSTCVSAPQTEGMLVLKDLTDSAALRNVHELHVRRQPGEASWNCVEDAYNTDGISKLDLGSLESLNALRVPDV